ncbi:MAG: class I SAM-dependent methyltransferase [Pseudomonadota bacterium]|nr:class I SAM-dependent methyltransferase [Pseudomonadota bacterium]
MSHGAEIAKGERFAFGENWSQFLTHLDEERIALAERSLVEMLEIDSLAGKRFLDVGSGSGLFSLAARRLGAEVTSFDYDPASAACTASLRQRYFPNDPAWTVTEASVLDRSFLASLGRFDVVYSWGVLHHTGAMWEALANVAPLVAGEGQLFIAIYNDQGRQSRRWQRIKRAYVGSSKPVRAALVTYALAKTWFKTIVYDAMHGNPLRSWRGYGKVSTRGMHPWRDLLDWVGGYPFEVATPEAILDFYRGRGFELVRMKTCGGGLGCNEFVFRRNKTASAS